MTAVQNVLAQVDWNTVMVICLVAIATLIVGKTLASLIGRQVASSMDKTSALITEKLVFYGVAVFGFAVILNVLEVGFTTLLAAGGVLGIALGFASQTAFSNIISGIFLIFERPSTSGTSSG